MISQLTLERERERERERELVMIHCTKKMENSLMEVAQKLKMELSYDAPFIIWYMCTKKVRTLK